MQLIDPFNGAILTWDHFFEARRVDGLLHCDVSAADDQADQDSYNVADADSMDTDTQGFFAFIADETQLYSTADKL